MSRLLIDTNILLMYVVGLNDPGRISSFKRTSMFDVKDFDLVVEQIRQHRTIVVTSSVITEVSNLLPEWMHQEIAIQVAAVVHAAHDNSPAVREIVDHPQFARFGFADCGIIEAANDPEVWVLTDDVRLYLELLSRKCNCMNFNHLRYPC